MSQGVNIQDYDFYLNFVDLDFGIIQIDEPIGVDAINLVIKSEKGRYSKDVYFGGGDDISLRFTSEKGSKGLGYGFKELLRCDNERGYQSKVEFLMKDRNEPEDVYYVVGRLEPQKRKTDLYSYFDYTITQSTTQQLLKRKYDVKVNVFSDTDLDGNPIEPVATTNLLVKAKPEVQTSEWYVPSETEIEFASLSEVPFYFNAINGVLKSEINNTLSFISDNTNNPENFVFIDAQDDLTNVKVEATGISFEEVLQSDQISSYYRIGDDFDTADEILIEAYGDGPYENISYNLDLTIPRGNRLWIYFKTDDLFLARVNFFSGSQTITATATAIDTVTPAVRLIDGINQVSKSINQEFEVIAPRFESQGEHYDQFIFSGDLVRGRNSAFNIEFKDIEEYLNSEPNCDHDLNKNTIFIGKEDDFYPNVEIGAFLQYPDDTFNVGYNERFTINQFEYKNKKYDQERDNKNTIDAIHTEQQYLLANDNVENKKSVECPFIRDAYLLSSTQRKASIESSSSLQEDSDIFIVDSIRVSPTQRGGFSARLNHFVGDDGKLKILATGLNWNILGFTIDNFFTIENTDNAGIYTIEEITDNVLTLNGVSPTTLGEVITEVSYPLSGVEYINRTNEGFDLVEGVIESNEYANLRYSIKRNVLKNYGSYLSTACAYNDEVVGQRFWKNWTIDGEDVLTQFNGGDIISEKSDISQSDLADPFLTPRTIITKVRCNLQEWQDLEQKIKQINETDTYVKTIGGFIRLYDNDGRVLKGYPPNMDYTWSNNILELELEQRFESDITTIVLDGGIYIINEVGYPEDLVNEINYEVSDTDYIQIFDVLERPLTNIQRYNKISVNGTVYDTIEQLTEALDDI